jgi:glucan endo-1,3-alpha-glucosidase
MKPERPTASISRRTAIAGAAALPLFATSYRTSSAQPVTTEPRAVFAHYMVCCPMAGAGVTKQDFAAEIRQAQAHDIDGFVLNCGGWSKEPDYPARASLMFAAASDLGTKFKLFFSTDGLTPDETVSMVTEFYDHPNMYRFQGRPVLSTFAGDEARAEAFLTPLATAGKPVFFVPFFYPRDPIGRDTERFTNRNLAQLVAENGFVDGYFYFGASGQGDVIAQRSRKIGQAWRDAGKFYMAPATPYYGALGPNNLRVFEYRGFEGMAAQWEAAINVGAQWVEIVTWNDWGEMTYVASFGSPSTTDLWNGHWGPRLSHEGYLAASTYYIRWFKTGDKRIHEDKLFWFYRLAPHSQPGQIDLDDGNVMGYPGGADKLQDRVFVTVFLTAPAQINIASGDRQYVFTLPAGVHHLDPEFADGPQRFSMARNGKTLLKGDGAFPITENNWAPFNYLSGQADHI